MNIKHYLSVLLLFLAVLPWSCRNDKPVEDEIAVKSNSSLYFYNSGLDTSDFEEKLRLYNKGLEIEAKKIDTVLPSLLEGKVYALIRLKNSEEAKIWSDSLIKAAKVLNDTYYLAKGNYWLYKLHREKNEIEPAYENLFRSKQWYLEMGDSTGAGWRSLDMAQFRYDLGDLTGTQESAIDALKLLDKKEYPHLVSGVYNTIGLSYLDRGFNEEAVKEFKTALEYSVNEKDSLVFLHNWALALKKQKKYDEALNIFERLIKSKTPSEKSKSLYINNYASTLWAQDSTRNVDSLFYEALNRRRQANDLYGLSDSYAVLSDYYYNKNKSQAEAYAKSFLEAAKELSFPPYELKALRQLIDLSPPVEARSYMDRYIFLEDSLDKVQLNAKYTFAKIEFDEKQKQRRIVQLQEASEKQLLLTDRLKWRAAFISLLFLFTVVTGAAWFYSFRQRSRREKLKEVYQTESRISRRIHDELANDLYGVMNRLSPIVPPKSIDQLEKIYRRTRDISRENAEIDTGENFQYFLNAMLSNSAGSAKLIIRGQDSVNWEKLSEEKKIILYRVLQELMINMRKHSGTSLVAVIFEQQQKKLEVQYSDSGKGARQEKLQNGNGLKNVKNRINSVGGKIQMESEEGKGMKIKLQIPL
ncbi:MAG: ATP-binding protein [Salinimicrobium sp.]